MLAGGNRAENIKYIIAWYNGIVFSRSQVPQTVAASRKVYEDELADALDAINLFTPGQIIDTAPVSAVSTICRIRSPCHSENLSNTTGIRYRLS